MTGRYSDHLIRLLIATAVAVLLLFAGPPVTAAAARPAVGCDCGPKVVDSKGDPLKVTPGKQPVLFVHGFLGDPIGTWSGKDGLADKLENNDDYVVGRFGYHEVHTNWVTDPGPNGANSIEKNLTTAIKCMARESGKKVILVGHSMGGLAIKVALKEPGVEGNVAGLVSLATPWNGILSSALTDVPGGPSSAVQAMKTGNSGELPPKLKELRKTTIPTGIPVLPVAGVVTSTQSEDIKNHTLPRTDLPTGQKVNLIGTKVEVFGQQRQAIAAADSKSSEGFDPWVGTKSALDPPANHVLKPLTLECKEKTSAPANSPGARMQTTPQPDWEQHIDSPPAQLNGNHMCALGVSHLGGYHSELPADPTFAEKVTPTIEDWRKLEAPSTGLGSSNVSGGCTPTPISVPIPTPERYPNKPKVDPKQKTCRHDEDLVGNHCEPKRVICPPSEKPVGNHCEPKQDRRPPPGASSPRQHRGDETDDRQHRDRSREPDR